jgi:hypothetical protein
MNQSLAKNPMRQDGWRDLSAGQRRRRKEESVTRHLHSLHVAPHRKREASSAKRTRISRTMSSGSVTAVASIFARAPYVIDGE